MKIYKVGILLLTLAQLAFGCSDEDATLVNPRLEVGEKVFSFDEAVTHTLAIEANGHWKAKAIKDSSEFIISPAEGNGNGEVTITLDRSKAGNINGYLKVTYADGTDEGLEVARGVKLLAGKLDMGVFPQYVTFNPAYVKQPLQVNIEGQWTATLSDTTWCSIDRREGEGQGSILLTLRDGVKLKEKNTELIIVPAAFPRVKYVVKIENYSGAYTHGKYVTVNKATMGKGVDIVLLGDGFGKKDLEPGGRWQQAIEKTRDSIFKIEPLKSYRDYFNLYAVAAPFPEGISLWMEEFTENIRTDFAEYTKNKMSILQPSGYGNAFAYAYEHTPVKADKGKMTEMLLFFMINSDSYADGYGGVAIKGDRDTYGVGATHNSAFMDLQKGHPLYSCFHHELIGHAFGGFHEEYFWNNELTGEDQKKAQKDHIKLVQERGWDENIEFTNNPDEFANQNWATLYRMGYPDVNIIEGAATFSKGAWRSSDKTGMGSGASADYAYFAPVQREILLRNIYKFAGKSDEYSLDLFIEYDKRNLKK